MGILCGFVSSRSTVLRCDLAGREDHDVTEENDLGVCPLGEQSHITSGLLFP